ncbi:MAG: rod shape-determining protein [Candidatus Dormibacteria bacterium]
MFDLTSSPEGWGRWRSLTTGLSAGLGIDLGTANTVVCRPPGRIILNEASVMVTPSDNGRSPAVLVGSAARELIGRTPVGMTAVRPVRDGVITDLQTARAFIIAILRQVPRRPWERLRPRAVVGVPAGATSLERRALIEAVEEAGVGHVDLLPEPIAGAVGCGLDPLAARASMVVDVGGGTAEVTAFCFGGILATRSCRVAGDEMTVALYQYLRQEHQLLVGELTAENLKMRLRDPARGAEPLVIEGRDVVSGRPRLYTLVPAEAAEALRPTVDGIIETLALCLSELPPQAVGDIMSDGVLAFGGGSLLQGFEERLEEAFGFPVGLADRPLTCVAEGAATVLGLPRVVAAYG